ncbi:PASTA domain-containing protein [Aureisphaera sp. CAU 1614]|uniref:PASTA domain-containing protein n=1 Tax=Halomarinibacterium sedimenti TaxID=2857106 RepID=A0A9X1FQX5_9FLAO|nr:PASTA domain-containing protein [Halomarinibacterium sedimenti]MAL58415.1 serine/threonine protein kinase [Flavobacteriaceae bacterium]MBW2939130.1 PASTA domain-containing protein [Halomarinibacterium sedimenti]|tara:strand:+ start:6981 stop:7613 length:633 start_codon:yes stop_codon:yes gene_type:complete
MSFLKFLFTKTFLKQLGYAVLVLFGLSLIILWWLRFSTNHGQQIEVPDLAKMTLEQAEEALDDLDLKLEVMDTTNYNPNFPYKTVIEQIPKAGKYVKENRKIYLSINRSGYPMIEVPPVVGKTMRQAEPTLKAVGFEIGKINYRRYIAKDEVLEISFEGKKINPGDKIQKTSVIDLVLGDGNGGLNREEVQEVQEELDVNSNTTEENGEN